MTFPKLPDSKRDSNFKSLLSLLLADDFVKSIFWESIFIIDDEDDDVKITVPPGQDLLN